ncbi:TetR/AcrR family transcriptional regulator [Lentibacillus sp. N15]|uniref:TetR/AcrR family transcriptional regulator n=1 Tax=Lentibacillus songyuanensis TaxID=3136161 RepID=UPI0031B9D5EA
MNKKEEIMQSAVRLFSEKGYVSTSVQEIANSCKISKGTLYKYFDSKEKLLIQVIEHSHKKMMQNAVNVNFDSSLSAKEKLIKKIIIQFEGFRDNKDFILILLRTILPQNNSEVSCLIKRIKVTMLNWYKDCLTEVYGSKVEPYIWDFSIMLQGVLREYTSLSFRDNKDIDSQHVARFVVETFERMIEHTMDLQPVLTSREMADFETIATDFEAEPLDEQLRKLLKELREKVLTSPIPEQIRHESIAAVHYLQQEVQEQKPRSFLIKSLLLYLAQIETCEPIIRRMEVILKAICTEKSGE